ncbi:FMN-binding protein [Knoellia sp. CPCC 206453]|uniref:FMN-binding protein n=1 Tax=Knoellia pratensis TaxID=3404796 RepID=UPI00361B51D6
MRRITLWLASTATMLVLLFSYHTSTSSGTTTSLSAPANDGTVAAAGSSSSGTTSSSSKTWTGDAASTRFGDVQVQITVADGKITAATVTEVPWQDHRDQEINSRAVPILTDETVSAQSAGIDMVSGATFTSQGYVESLQSALDQAGL